MDARLRIGLLNLDWRKRDRRTAQAHRLSRENLDVLCLTEIHAGDIARFAADAGLTWHRYGLVPGGRRTGVAICGGSCVEPGESVMLQANEFQSQRSAVDAAMALLFSERQLAVDVRMGSRSDLRVGVFAPPPAEGWSTDRRPIGERKPWFHDRVAAWVAEWHAPHLFATDANTPIFERLDPSVTVFWYGQERALLGERAVHQCHDLWREWLDSPRGEKDRKAVPQEGPLAQSFRTGRASGWRRYDQIWASEGVRPSDMRYEYDPALSDHALVTATITVP